MISMNGISSIRNKQDAGGSGPVMGAGFSCDIADIERMAGFSALLSSRYTETTQGIYRDDTGAIQRTYRNDTGAIQGGACLNGYGTCDARAFGKRGSALPCRMPFADSIERNEK